MGVNTITRRGLLLAATMKRRCALCLQEHRYDKVKMYTTKRAKHALQLCNYCMDVLYFEISDMIKKYG